MSPLHALVLFDHSPSLQPQRLMEAFAAWKLGTMQVLKTAPEVHFQTTHGLLTLRRVNGPIAAEKVEPAAKRSVARFSTEAKWRRHTHQVEVTLAAPGFGVAVCTAFTRALAAIAQACSGVGIYWSSGDVAHDADFFIHASEDDVPLMLWSAVEVKRDGSNPKQPVVFVSSAGLGQFGLPELQIVAPSGRVDEAIGYLLDLGAQVVERGKALPEGATQGLDGESISARYDVPSPGTMQCATVPLPER